MPLHILSTVLRLVVSAKEVIQHWVNFRRTRQVKKDYRDGRRSVRRGEVDKINEILRSLIPFIVFSWVL